MTGCRNNKGSDQLCCKDHWRQVPKEVQRRIWELYRNGKKREEHRKLCLEVLANLNHAVADGTAPTPVRRWGDMTAAEQQRIREQTRPPAPRPPAEAEERRRRAQAGENVDVWAQRLVTETARAALFVINGAEVWVPKSVLVEREQQPDETWVLVVKGWFAKKEGLLDG